MKYIKTGNVLTVDGYKLQLPKKDEDGNIVWKVAPAGPGLPGEPEQEYATTISIISYIATTIPKSIQTPNDGFRIMQILSQIDKPPIDKPPAEDGYLVLEDKEYKWLHNLLGRTIPRTKEEKDADVKQITYAVNKFGTSEWAIRKQLTDKDTLLAEPED